MNEHTEKTLDSDGRKRQGGRKKENKKKKSRIFMVRVLRSDCCGIY